MLYYATGAGALLGGGYIYKNRSSMPKASDLREKSKTTVEAVQEFPTNSTNKMKPDADTQELIRTKTKSALSDGI